MQVNPVEVLRRIIQDNPGATPAQILSLFETTVEDERFKELELRVTALEARLTPTVTVV